MFCLSKRNRFRLFFIRLIENTWFERIITLNIILCSIALFLYTYADLLCPNSLAKSEKETCLLENEAGINRDKILNKIFAYFFNIIFLIELLCKIIAKGLLLHKLAYLRSFWNAIDCFATVYSFLEVVYPFLGKTVILRVIRLLRIIKNIKSFESIKKQINCIMLAIPTIANVLLFLGFIFTVFATLGIQLFSGDFYKRCRSAPIGFYSEGEGNGLKFHADPVTPYLCNKEGIYGKCPNGTFCVGFYNIPEYFNLTERNITIDNFDISRENLSTNFILFYAIPNFDSIINCFINVFVLMTYQNWTDIYSIVIDSNSTLMVNLYFNIIVIFGGFFIMKMIFAAQNEVFIKVMEDEQENKLLILQKFSKANPQIAGLVEIDLLLQNINSIETAELFRKIEKVIAESNRIMGSVGKNLNKKVDYEKNDFGKNYFDDNNLKNTKENENNEDDYNNVSEDAKEIKHERKQLEISNLYANAFDINKEKLGNELNFRNEIKGKFEKLEETEEINESEDYDYVENKRRKNRESYVKNDLDTENYEMTVSKSRKSLDYLSENNENTFNKINQKEVIYFKENFNEEKFDYNFKSKEGIKKKKLTTTKDKLHFYDFSNIDKYFFFENRTKRSSLDFLNTKKTEDIIGNYKHTEESTELKINNNKNDKNLNEEFGKYAEIISRKSSYDRHKLFINQEEKNKNVFIEKKNKKKNHIEEFICDLENLNNFEIKDSKEKFRKDFGVKINEEIELANKRNYSINIIDSTQPLLVQNQISEKKNANKKSNNNSNNLYAIRAHERKDKKNKSKSNSNMISLKLNLKAHAENKNLLGLIYIDINHFKKPALSERQNNTNHYINQTKEVNYAKPNEINKLQQEKDLNKNKNFVNSKSLSIPVNKNYVFISNIKYKKKENKDFEIEEKKVNDNLNKITQNSKFAKNQNEYLTEKDQINYIFSNTKQKIIEDKDYSIVEIRNETNLNFNKNQNQHACHLALDTKDSTNEKDINSKKNLNKYPYPTLISNTNNPINNSICNNELAGGYRKNTLVNLESQKNEESKPMENSDFNINRQNIFHSLGYREKENTIPDNYYSDKVYDINDNLNFAGLNNYEINNDNKHFGDDETKKSKNSFFLEKLNEYKENFINKLKLLILEEHSKTPHYIIFNSIIFFVNLLNFIFLLTIHHQMESWQVQRIVMINIACSGIFVIEIIFKILVLGRSYFKDLMNVLDFVVIFAGIAEIAVTNYNSDPYDNANSDIIALRAIRFLRILKLFTKKSYLGKFLNFINKSLKDLFIFTILLGFFILIFALTGREFFTNKIHMQQNPDTYSYIFPGDISPRENFDTIIDSLITVFILFIGDNWGRLMFQYARVSRDNAYLFFILIIICGNIMLFNLFLSILISNYENEFSNFLENAEDEEDDDLIDQNVKKVKKMYSQVFNQASKAVNKITDKFCRCFFSKSSEDNADKSFENPIDQSENKQLRVIDQVEISALAVHRRAGKISDSLRNFKPTEDIKLKNKISGLSSSELNNNNNSLDTNNKNQIIKKKNSILNFFRGSESFSPEDLRDIIPMIGKSLMLFPRKSKFRRKIWLIVTRSQAYEYFNMFSIVLSLLVLAIDDSFLTDKSLIKQLFYLDCFTNFTFLVEFLLKIISFGLIFNGAYSYLRSILNMLDLGSLVVSIIYIIVNSYQVFEDSSLILTISELNALNISEEEKKNKKAVTKIFQIIKMLRLLRLMKLIEKSKFLQAASRTILKSLKQTLVIILIGSGFILMFSVAAITYFRGLFHRCDFSAVPAEFMYEVHNKWDCLDFGGVWVNPHPNFDNIKNSFIMLFEMMTTENWVFYMYSGIDGTAIDKQPVRDSKYGYVLYFIFYMIFAYFFMLNLSISILFKNFKSEKADMENSYFKLPLQKEFFKIFEKLYKLSIPIKKQKPNKITKVLLNILDSIYFDVVITVCIVANLITLMMNTPGMDQRTMGFIAFMNIIFNWVFIFEAVFKIYVYRCQYFKNPWNIIDFIIVTDNLVNLLLKSFIELFSTVFDTSILRAIRVARILRLLKKAKTLNKIFNLFLNSIQPMISIGILYAILLFFYAIVGMSVFQYVKHQEIISRKWNFETFSNAFLMLIRITSGESWNIVMHECSKKRSLNFFCKYDDELNQADLKTGNIGCGTIFAIPYFFSFVIISNMLFVQFFSVIIATTIIDTYSLNLEPPKKAHLDKFMNNWIKHDKEKSGFMKVDSLQKFLFQIGFPFGISTMKPSEYAKLINVLEIPTYEKLQFVFFYDCIVELTKYSMITNTVSEEFRSLKLFKNQEKVIEDKTKMFDSINSEIVEMKTHVVMKNLNPYYKQEKYSSYLVDKMSSVNFKKGEIITLNYAWGIKGISRFIRLYKFIRSRSLKIMQSDCFSDESLVDYANLYYEHLNVLKLKTLYINADISHISEEDENSEMEASNRGASEADLTEPNYKNIIKQTSDFNSKNSKSDNNSYILSNILGSDKSISKSSCSSKDYKIKFINRNKISDKNITDGDNNLAYENQQSDKKLLNKAEKETEIIFDNLFNKKNSSNKDAEIFIINNNISNKTKNKSSNKNNILLQKQKTYVKDLKENQTLKTFSSKNLNFNIKSGNNNINILRSNICSNDSKNKDIRAEYSSKTFTDLMAIPKISVKKKIDEKKELKAEIEILRSNNQEFLSRRKFKETSKQRKINIKQFDGEMKANNIDYSGEFGYISDNGCKGIERYEEKRSICDNAQMDGNNESVEIINSERNRDGKNLKILEKSSKKSKNPELEQENSAESHENSLLSNYSFSQGSEMQGRTIKDKYMNANNINFNCNSGNIIIINKEPEETQNEEKYKNDFLINNDKNKSNNNNTNNYNYKEFGNIDSDDEKKLYILDALKKNLEMQNEKAKEEESSNILQNFNKIVEIKNKEQLLKQKNTKGFNRIDD